MFLDILGLGGDAKVIGRATEISKYVKIGYNEAVIEIELYNPNGSNDIINRKFDIKNNSRFFLNSTHVSKEKIERLTQKYHIQINNLCQILPQEKLELFAKMNNHERLVSTLQTVGDSSLGKYLKEIKESGDKELYVKKKIKNMKNELAEIISKRDSMEVEARMIKEKQFLIECLRLLKQRRAWQIYFHLKQTINIIDDLLIKKQSTYQNVVQILKETLSDIQASNANVMNQKEISSKINENIVQYIQEIKRKQNTIELSTEKINEIKTSFNEKVLKFKTQTGNINSLNEKILKLQDDICDVSQVTEKIENMKLTLSEEKQKVRESAHSRDMMSYELETKRHELNAINIKLSKMNDMNELKIKTLERYYPDSMVALKWLENHRNLFRGEVYGPMFLYLNIKDTKNAKYVENSIANRDLTAFICQYREDTNILLKECHEKQKLRINVVSALDNVNENDLCPPIPIENINQFGFHSYVSNFVEGPVIIVQYLILTYHLHEVPIGDQKTFSMADRIPSDIKVYFTNEYRISISRAELTGQKIESSNEISEARLLQVNVNLSDLEELQTKKKYLDEKIEFLKDQYNHLNEAVSDGDSRLKELGNEMKKLSSRQMGQKHIQETLKNKMRELHHLQNNVIDLDIERNKQNLEVKFTLAKICNLYLELAEMLTTLFELFNKYQLNKIKERQAEKIHNENLNITAKFVNDLKVEISSLHNLELKKKKLIKFSSGIHQWALKYTNNIDPRSPQFKKRKMFFKINSNVVVLHKLINKFQAKINCLGNSNNGLEIFLEYKKLFKAVDRLKHKIERKEQNLELYNEKMKEIKEMWLKEVKNLIDTINKHFQKFFANMNCAGEISLYQGENKDDFSQYGIHIKVKFRDKSDLQILNAQVQSGGERAVSVAIFLLSLQELTTVPFRCIDEINQGMDADNERRIMNLIMNTTEEKCQTQYFLLTPKLLPKLNFTATCKIFCPFNGVGSLSHEKISQKIEKTDFR